MKTEGFEKSLFVKFGGSKTVCVSANLGGIKSDTFRELDLEEQIERFNEKANGYELHPPEIDNLRWDKSAKFVWITFEDNVETPYDREDYYVETGRKTKAQRKRENGEEPTEDEKEVEHDVKEKRGEVHGGMNISSDNSDDSGSTSAKGDDYDMIRPMFVARSPEDDSLWVGLNDQGGVITREFEKKSGDGDSIRNALEDHFDLDGFTGADEKDDDGNKIYRIDYDDVTVDVDRSEIEWLLS